jgi:hypothetical protein
MNLLIDYNSKTSPINQATRILLPVEKAIALDGIRILFLSIKATAQRLEERLLAVSDDSQKTDVPVESGLIIMEVDRFLNEAYRLFALTTKHIAGAPGGEREKVMANLKLLRHSSQHAEERITEHFYLNGDSLYGDLFWLYRASLGSVQHQYTLVSGVTRAGSTTLANPDYNNVPENTVGIYGLNYQSVVLPNRKPSTKPQRITISLMQVGQLVNELIDHLEATCLQLIAKFKHENNGREPLPSGMAPIIYSIAEVR